MRNRRPASFSRRCSKMPTAVNTTAPAMTSFRLSSARLSMGWKCSHTSAAAEAGKLPAHKRRTTPQSMSPWWLWMRVAAIFVSAANQRSVPTAVMGAMPNTSNSSGVMSAPPPTPVSPTRVPVTKPAMICRKSMPLC